MVLPLVYQLFTAIQENTVNSWQEFWEAVSVYQFFIWIAGIGLVVTVVVKLWPTVRKAIQLTDALAELPRHITKMDAFVEEQKKFNTGFTKKLTDQQKQLGRIDHEVHFNNGTSLKDAALRTERKVDEMHSALVAVRDDMDELERTHPHPPKA